MSSCHLDVISLAKMRNFTAFACFALSFLSIAPFAGSPAQSAIFGEDDRSYANASTPVYAQARATAIGILRTLSAPSSVGKLDIYVDPLSTSVCKSEKFSDDPSLTFSCSGFLVAPDLLVTAGHCEANTGKEVKNDSGGYCEVFDWLFDYSMPVSGTIDLGAVPAEHLYHCKQIIYAVSDETAPYRDYALIRLDRPVLDRAPLKLSSSASLGRNEKLSMIGYPFGTPAKWTPHGKVLYNNPSRTTFITNLDAFEGNSGSPVFNAENEVVGILIAGTPSNDFVEDSVAKCSTYNRCNKNGENCMLPDKDTSQFPGYQSVGSEVSRIAPIVELLKSSAK